MKKIMKISAAVLSAAALMFVSCQNDPESSKHDSNAKAVDLIKFNFTDAKSIGANFTAGSSSSRTARAADDEEDWSDVERKYKEDGSSETLVENADDEQKIDFGSFEKVQKIIRNTYSNIPESAGGLYTLFAKPNTSVKYEDSVSAPSLGQLIYTKKDGSIVDISGDKYISTNNAKDKGYDFIEFADTGKAFFMTENWEEATKTTNEVFWCFNPEDDTVTEITLGITTKYSVDSFRINKDGSWAFISTIEDCEAYGSDGGAIGITHVYAVPLANPENKQELYLQPENNKTYCKAGKISYDSCTNMMYFGIEEDQNPMESGIYLYRSNGKRFYFWDNGYSSANVINYDQVGDSFIASAYNYYKNYKKLEDDAVFAQIAKDIKNKCDIKHCDYNPADGSSDDIEINLSYFADKTEYADIYDAAAKDGTAIKILFDNIYPNGIADFSATYSSIDYGSAFYKFLTEYQDELKADGLNSSAVQQYPIDKICFLKDSEGKATTTTAAAFRTDEKLKKLINGNILMMGELVSTSNGCWGWNRMQNWEGGSLNYTYSSLVQVTDAAGNFVSEYPDALKDVEGYFSWYTDARTDDDPWYQNPYSVSEDGVALISRDRKGIYLFDGTTVKNLMEGNENLSSIEMIYTITLENGYLSYTAKKTDGNWITEEIKLEDSTHTKFDTTERLSSVAHWE